MPTVEADTISHVESTLKAYLKGGSQSGDLSQSISSSVKKALLEDVEFAPAAKPVSIQVDELRNKYISLNPGAGDVTAVSNGGSSSNGIEGGNNRKAADDMPEPKVVLYPASKVQLNWPNPRRIGPGLINMGNTCFLNSVLQCLTYTAPFANYILSGEHKASCQRAGVGFCGFCALGNHITRALTGQQSVIKPEHILHNIRCFAKDMSWGKQEDSHEFLRLLLDHIQKASYRNIPNLDNLSKETTVINQIFGGFLRSQVLCLKCRHKSSIYEPFLDLSLDIKNVTSILKALERFVCPDHLEGKNAYKCTSCKSMVQAQKRFSIHRAPNVLTLQLKRFQFGGSIFGGSGKMTKHVQFPTRLDLRPYMSVTKGEHVWYNLYGVICHSGYSCNSGHYFAYVFAPNRSWYVMNDSQVHQVPISRVVSAEAYMLFYLKATHGGDRTPKPKIGPQLPSSPKVLGNANNSSNSASFTPGLKRPLVSETVTKTNAHAHAQGSKIPPANQRERVSFGIKLPNQQPAQQTASPPKERIVISIKGGKVIYPQSPSKPVKETKSPSKLVPYGGDSDEEEDVGTPVDIKTAGAKDPRNDKAKPTGLSGRNVRAGSLSPERKPRSPGFTQSKEIHTDRVLSSPPKKPTALKRSLSMDGLLSVNTNVQPKLNATGGRWQVSERNVAQSPSLASECSNASSVNSTTEWSVRDKQDKAKKPAVGAVDPKSASPWTVLFENKPSVHPAARKLISHEMPSDTSANTDRASPAGARKPASPDKAGIKFGESVDGMDLHSFKQVCDGTGAEYRASCDEPLFPQDEAEEFVKPHRALKEDVEPEFDDSIREKHKKKKKKKKHKKHKHEDRERLLESSQSESEEVTPRKHSKKKRYSQDSDTGAETDEQLVWVEKTKETLEQGSASKKPKYGDEWGHKREADPWSTLDQESTKKVPDPWSVVGPQGDSPGAANKVSGGKSHSASWDRNKSGADLKSQQSSTWNNSNGGTPGWGKPPHKTNGPWAGPADGSSGSFDHSWDKPQFSAGKRSNQWSDSDNRQWSKWEDKAPGGSGSGHWDGTRSSNTDVLNELRGYSGARGFGGGRVQAWDGGRSAVDRSVDEDRAYERKERFESYDSYEEELDQGRVKKLKRKFEDMAHAHQGGGPGGHNPFQRYQDVRNTYGPHENWQPRNNNRNYESRGRWHSGPPGGHYRHNNNNRRGGYRGGGGYRPRHSYGGGDGGYNGRPHHQKYHRNY